MIYIEHDRPKWSFFKNRKCQFLETVKITNLIEYYYQISTHNSERGAFKFIDFFISDIFDFWKKIILDDHFRYFLVCFLSKKISIHFKNALTFFCTYPISVTTQLRGVSRYHLKYPTVQDLICAPKQPPPWHRKFLWHWKTKTTRVPSGFSLWLSTKI